MSAQVQRLTVEFLRDCLKTRQSVAWVNAHAAEVERKKQPGFSDQIMTLLLVGYSGYCVYQTIESGGRLIRSHH